MGILKGLGFKVLGGCLFRGSLIIMGYKDYIGVRGIYIYIYIWVYKALGSPKFRGTFFCGEILERFRDVRCL